MKQRIKIDSSILSFIIILTGVSFLFKEIYLQNEFFDNILDFIGVVIILKGTFTRMIARGYKKAHSDQGKSLVIEGPYVLTRNPMYLGSFLMGVGFVLVLWPWWSLPIFALLFYLRFNRQMVTEEEHLTKTFGDEYTAYCKKVPRLFPSYAKLWKVKPKDIINLDDAMSTKEIRGLILWPLLAFGFELFQQMFVMGDIKLYETYVLFLSAICFFCIGFVVRYMRQL